MVKRQSAKTVLIIEDEENIQKFISRVLELEGYTVYRTGDGFSGMEIIKKGYVSLVLLDLRLPTRPDGLSILRELKRNHTLSGIPVVVLTAAAEASQRRRTLRLGAANYLVKPVSAHLLTQTVHNALKRKMSTPVAAGHPSPAG